MCIMLLVMYLIHLTDANLNIFNDRYIKQVSFTNLVLFFLYLTLSLLFTNLYVSRLWFYTCYTIAANLSNS